MSPARTACIYGVNMNSLGEIVLLFKDIFVFSWNGRCQHRDYDNRWTFYSEQAEQINTNPFVILRQQLNVCYAKSPSVKCFLFANICTDYNISFEESHVDFPQEQRGCDI